MNTKSKPLDVTKLENTEQDEDSSALIDALQQGATLKDLQSIPDKTMDGVYKLAYDFYQQGKLADAESLFKFLCIYDFYNPEYSIGLAAVYQLQKKYSKAIDFYALSYSLSEGDYRPMFYAGECNLLLGKTPQAKQCFNVVIDKCVEKNLVEKAEQYLLLIDDILAEQEQ